uniref:Uncharacterized protein LOC114338353 isoform X2 n=1 Tax=Diabrotica virgifera virgifera TaxID=50390 RepID=A0A6P7G6R3_DIAVI
MRRCARLIIICLNFQFSLLYGSLMRNFAVIQGHLKKIADLVSLNTRPASTNLLRKMNRLGHKFKLYSCLFISMLLPYYTASYWMIRNSKTNIALIIFRHLPGAGGPAVQIITFAFVIPHSVFFSYGILCLMSYFSWHYSFLLKRLNEEIIKLSLQKNKHHDISEQMQCTHCQQEVFGEMTYFLNQYLRIKKSINSYTDFSKWRIFSLVIGISGILGSALVFIVAVSTYESMPYYCSFAGAFMGMLVIAESGEGIRSEVIKIIHGFLTYYKTVSAKSKN